MKNKEDLRITRTRRLLSTALFSLLETTPYEKITVIDICEKAMVHRATFYNHFKDKEELLEYTIDEIKEHLFSSSVQNDFFTSPKEMYMTLISKVLDFVDENRKQLMLIIKNNNMGKGIMILLTSIKRSIAYLIGKNRYKTEFILPTNVMVDFLAGGITNLGINWLISEKPCPKQDLLKYFDLLLSDTTYIKKND